uniref:Uncharacterized protein n=1 Tax=Timema bartmani TaxID=61472 RepID=A0A7R9F2Z3_9NEOP|nr:unnamed protein product [Timema bartmani]
MFLHQKVPGLIMEEASARDQSDNLPKIDSFMMASCFASNSCYISVEIRKEEADLIEDVNNQVQFYDPCIGTMRSIPNVFTSKDKPKEEADLVEDVNNQVQFYDPCSGIMRSIPNVFTSKDKSKVIDDARKKIVLNILWQVDSVRLMEEEANNIRQMNPMHVVSACSFKAAVPNLFQFAYPQLAWFLSAYPQTQILQAPHLPNLFHPLQIPKTSLKKGLLMYKSPCVTYHVSDTSWNKTGAIRRAILLHRSENTTLDRSEQRKQLNVACGRLVVWSLVCLGLRLSTLSDVFTSNKLHATSSHDDDAEGPTGPTKVLATYPELLGSIPGASIFFEKSFQIIWEAVALERATQLNITCPERDGVARGEERVREWSSERLSKLPEHSDTRRNRVEGKRVGGVSKGNYKSERGLRSVCHKFMGVVFFTWWMLADIRPVKENDR